MAHAPILRRPPFFGSRNFAPSFQDSRNIVLSTSATTSCPVTLTPFTSQVMSYLCVREDEACGGNKGAIPAIFTTILLLPSSHGVQTYKSLLTDSGNAKSPSQWMCARLAFACTVDFPAKLIHFS
ncbi:hypothetical protein BaRGS_00002417 [Batillaria attramentaria]|uniref:Uncharacterized protein n=1 Tax=Batillaria attramentaria TaxID=370345 RepID=A0ABD0M3E9_9CAEN